MMLKFNPLLRQGFDNAGGSMNDKGYFPDVATLQTAYPIGQAGWYSLIGDTDTFWAWDDDTNTWINTGVIASPDYVNAGVNNIAVGGIGANSGPFNTSMKDMFDRLLYPFQQMSGSLSTNPTHTAYYEKGVPIFGVTLTATHNNSQNPRYPVTQVVFKRNGVIIDTKSGLDLASPQSFVSPGIEVSTITFSAEISSSQPHTVTSSRTLNFVTPMYVGHAAAGAYNTWLGYGDIPLTKRIVPQGNQVVTDTFTNSRNVFMYPATYPDLTSIIDNNGFETISNYDKFTKSYLMADGLTVLFKVYQLKNDASQTSFTNTYKF